MPALSAVVITCDNERTIAATLAGLAWCDEVLVVDSGSRDRTLDICRDFRCRILRHEFAGFGRQKHAAVEAAAHDWVLVVDSDEIVTAALREEIAERLRRDANRFAGYEIPIRLVFLGRMIRFGGEHGKRHLRLFDRRAGNFNFAEVHERVILEGQVGYLANHMVHASYRDLEHYFEKFNRYTTTAARQLAARGSRANHWYAAMRFPASFFHFYVLRGLMFDGYPGFVWALLAALYPTIKYMKFLEMRSLADRSGR